MTRIGHATQDGRGYESRALLEPSDVWKHGGGSTQTSLFGHWEHCVTAVRDFDQDFVGNWRGDMDNVLIFAALFSAIVTAFIIESYQSLSQDPTTQLLSEIVARLNQSSTTSTADNTSFSPDTSSVIINVFWFTSLILSVNTAVMAIVIKQWLLDYTWNISSKPASPQSVLVSRQFRYEGLIKWKLPLMVALVPVLLLTAVLCFFAGLLCLVWTLHATVAAFCTVLVFAALLFLGLTSLFPAIHLDCPYRSPQSWMAYYIKQRYSALFNNIPSPKSWYDVVLDHANAQGGQEYAVRALKWCHAAFDASDSSLFSNLWKCACDLEASIASHTLCAMFCNLNVPEHSTADKYIMSLLNVSELERGYEIILREIPTVSETANHVHTLASIFPAVSKPSPGAAHLIKLVFEQHLTLSDDQWLLLGIEVLEAIEHVLPDRMGFDPDSFDILLHAVLRYSEKLSPTAPSNLLNRIFILSSSATLALWPHKCNVGRHNEGMCTLFRAMESYAASVLQSTQYSHREVQSYIDMWLKMLSNASEVVLEEQVQLKVYSLLKVLFAGYRDQAWAISGPDLLKVISVWGDSEMICFICEKLTEQRKEMTLNDSIEIWWFSDLSETTKARIIGALASSVSLLSWTPSITEKLNRLLYWASAAQVMVKNDPAISIDESATIIFHLVDALTVLEGSNQPSEWALLEVMDSIRFWAYQTYYISEKHPSSRGKNTPQLLLVSKELEPILIQSGKALGKYICDRLTDQSRPYQENAVYIGSAALNLYQRLHLPIDELVNAMTTFLEAGDAGELLPLGNDIRNWVEVLDLGASADPLLKAMRKTFRSWSGSLSKQRRHATLEIIEERISNGYTGVADKQLN